LKDLSDGCNKNGINTVFLIVSLLFPGIILLIVKRREKLGKVLLVAGLFLLCILSFTPFSNILLRVLESKYPPLMDLRGYREIKYIVVLTAWDSNVQTIPYIQNLGYRSAFRTLEAHRIYKELPYCKIIISGSEVGGKLMSMFLVLLSVPEKNIIIDHSANTLKSAVNVKDILGNQSFILVTSAVHLPRSMRFFVNEGLRPIPAPADYLYGYYSEYKLSFKKSLTYYVPNTDAFMRSSAAVYEYLAILRYHIEGLRKA